MAELSRAQAAIVIWTPDSVRSDWVYSEASRARARRMLIPVRDEKVTLEDIPPPFDALHGIAVQRRGDRGCAGNSGSSRLASPQPQDTAEARGELSEASVAERSRFEHWQAIEHAADLREIMSWRIGTSGGKLARDRLAGWRRRLDPDAKRRRTPRSFAPHSWPIFPGAQGQRGRGELAALRRSRRTKQRPPSAPAPSRRSIVPTANPEAGSPPGRKPCAPAPKGAKPRNAGDMRPMPAPNPRAGGCPYSPFHL